MANMTTKDWESLAEQCSQRLRDCGSTRTEMMDAQDEVADLLDPDIEIEQDSDGTWILSEPDDSDGDGIPDAEEED